MDSDSDSPSSSSSSSSSSSDREDFSDATKHVQKTSGITLVLPSLSSLKAQRQSHEHQRPQHELSFQQPAQDLAGSTSTQKKAKPRKKLYFTSTTGTSSKKKRDPAQKVPRPVKLKPLKQVLTRLISQIKKKDDYAFFLEPVDTKAVAGYTDVVKRPMDLGTMTNKVARGRYRSLEEFAADFRLVVNNAKLFNPLGSIHYTEAERIEAYGLDHIAKATTTVIQYETDWNIDIEHDEDQPLKIDDDDAEGMMDNGGTPVPSSVMDDSRMGSPVPSGPGPSSSVTPLPPRRGGPNRVLRQTAAAVPSATPSGHGKRDKEGTPPVKSAAVSESLDENGRMPGVKDGLAAFPPGSDFARTMLEIKLKRRAPKTKKERLRLEKVGNVYRNDGSLAFAEMKDPFSILSFFIPDPLCKPILHLLYGPTVPTETAASFPPAITLPPETIHASLSSTSSAASQPPPQSQNQPHPPAQSAQAQPRLKHWNISRHPINRQRAQDKEREQKGKERELSALDDKETNLSREAGHLDYGSFAVLAAELDAEMKKRGLTSAASAPVSTGLQDAVSPTGSAAGASAEGGTRSIAKTEAEKYWSSKAIDAERYLRDIVYGGMSGIAYARSLAEFVSLDLEKDDATTEPARNLEGLTLAAYVACHILDPLTGDRHTLLRETAEYLLHPPTIPDTKPSPALTTRDVDSTLRSSIARELHAKLEASQALEQLIGMRNEQVDMCALVKSPEELFMSEEEWVGKKHLSDPVSTTGMMDNPLSDDAMDVDGDAIDVVVKQAFLAGGDVLGYSLKHTADVIEKMVLRNQWSAIVKTEDPEADDSDMRHLRLNLLALAKRAPLEKVSRLPKDLIPAHIRMHVPSLET